MFIPELTIDEVRVNDNTYSNYINNKLLPLDPILIPMSEEFDSGKFFDYIIDCDYDINDNNIYQYVFGVFHGTPFLIFNYNNNKNLYLLCPSKNSHILLDVIVKLIQSFK